MSQYLTTIGLEFHAELKTKTKIFCSCPTDFSGDANTHICPVDVYKRQNMVDRDRVGITANVTPSSTIADMTKSKSTMP